MKETKIKLAAMFEKYVSELTLIITIILICAMGIGFTTPLEDPDFFWHLNTGKWIFQNNSIPSFDPFSFTVGSFNPFRPTSPYVQLILKDYWLGQLLLYGVWNLGGVGAIILLRAFIYSIILIFSAWWMRKISSGFFPIILLFLLGNTLFLFPNERPQIFAFLLFPFLLYLLDRIGSSENFSKFDLFLPLLMMIWANIHPSYLLGCIIVSIHFIIQIVRGLIAKNHNIRKLLIFLVGIVAGFINPNGYKTILLVIGGQTATPNFEYIPPLEAMMKFHVGLHFYWIFLALALWGIIISLVHKKITWEHLLVLTVIILLSLTASRYVAFVLLASPLLIRYLPRTEHFGFILLSLVILLMWMPVIHYRPVFQLREHSSFPANAVRFLNIEKPEGNLFNYYDWGGYVGFYSPQNKVFTDGRYLVEEFKKFHDELAFGKSLENILTYYKINTVLIPVWAKDGERLTLPYKLLRSDDWFPIYSDDVAVIFVRNTHKNIKLIEKYQLPKIISPDING